MSASAAEPTPPAAPTGLVAVPSWNRVELTWDDSGDPSITGFQVLRGSDADSLVVIESDATGAYTLPYTDWEVTPVTTYVYAVQAVNDLGVGAQSITVEVVTPKEPTLVLFPERLPRGDVPAVPAAPTGLVAVPSWNRVELTWDDSGDPSITGFQVLRGSDADSLVVIESDATGAYTLPYTDWEVTPVTTYVYAVQAVNDLGVGAQSITVEVVTPKEPTLVVIPERLPRGDVPAVPAAPTGLVAVPSWNRVELTWDDSGDPSITGFQVLRGSDADSLVVIESDATGAYTLPYTDWEVTPVTTYVYAVQAVNDLGVGAQSITVEVVTPKEPTLVVIPERLPRGDVPAAPTGRPSNPSPRPSKSPSPSGSGNGEGVVEPQPPADGFSDLADAGVHEDAVRELDREGLLVGSGCGDGRLCPTEVLPRREMAVWLVRIIDGEEPAPTTTSRFEDVDADLWWAAHVERLAELGITIGCSVDALLFCPDELVKRSQMANFLTRAFQLEVGGPPAGFEDVSVRSNDAPNINAVFAAGVTLGCSTDPLLFCPSEPVKRSQMASFLVRARVYRNPQIGARETS